MARQNLHDHALDVVSRGRNILITGPAGTGKTTLMGRLVEQCGIENMLMTGPTGVSALQLQKGQTLHSLMRIPTDRFMSDGEIKNHYLNLIHNSLWMKQIYLAKYLVVDEISMVSAYMLNLLDIGFGILRNQRHLPMGGLQVIFVGDFLQLPPIYRKKDVGVPDTQGLFAFQSEVWAALNVEVILLTRVFRQEDVTFSNFLSSVRRNEKFFSTHPVYAAVRAQPAPAADKTLHICYKRETVKHFNDIYMSRIKSNYSVKYKFPLMSVCQSTVTSGSDLTRIDKYIGTVREVLSLENNPDHQLFTEGMRVMMIRNTTIGGVYFANGSIGTLIGFRQLDDINTHGVKEIPIVCFNPLKPPVDIFPMRWVKKESFIRYDEDRMPHFTDAEISVSAFPLIPAWAITSHRAQGTTISEDVPVHVDATSMNFSAGSFYVAISRCRKREQLYIDNFTNFCQDPQALSFYRGDAIWKQIPAKKYESQLHIQEDPGIDEYFQRAMANCENSFQLARYVMSSNANKNHSKRGFDDDNGGHYHSGAHVDDDDYEDEDEDEDEDGGEDEDEEEIKPIDQEQTDVKWASSVYPLLCDFVQDNPAGIKLLKVFIRKQCKLPCKEKKRKVDSQ